MSQRKGSTRTYHGAGDVQNYAKELQRTFKLTYATALERAKTLFGVTGPYSAMDVLIGNTPTLLSVAFTSEVTLNGATAASYAWDFGDGQSDTTEDATNVYASAGIYTIWCTVTDTLGFKSSGKLVLEVFDS